MEISKAIMKITTTAGRLTGKAALSSAQYAWNHRDKIATGTGMAVAATGSAVKGAAGFAYDAASIKLYSNDRTEQLRQSIAAQGKRYRDLVSERLGDGRVVDSLTVGGTCLADIIKDGHASREVEAAFAAQYPHLAAHSTFAEEAAHRYGKDLMGLVSGVKGKLFEIRYVDYLNHGVLPDGYTAHLAESSVQPAWDIAVDGPDGHLSRLLQLKATDSTSYVRQALEHHPDIDVVTTDEVRSHLLMHGGAEHIVGSGVTDHDLTGQVFNATGDAYNMHWSPPLVSLGARAWSKIEG